MLSGRLGSRSAGLEAILDLRHADVRSVSGLLVAGRLGGEIPDWSLGSETTVLNLRGTESIILRRPLWENKGVLWDGVIVA